MSDTPDSRTSITLFQMLRNEGSRREAWQEFDRRYRPQIYAWCRRWGLQDADAEDTTQNVLTKLSQLLPEFQYDPERRFRSWLKTVTNNACNDYADQLRARAGTGDSAVLRLLQTQEARNDLARNLEEKFDHELLETAMQNVQQRVTPQTWEAFRLTALDLLSGAAAGAQLDIPASVVFLARHRVKKLLQEEVARLEQEVSAGRGPSVSAATEEK
jgi:RNA polymerase sigma-70 factor (ECF subfamily)